MVAFSVKPERDGGFGLFCTLKAWPNLNCGCSSIIVRCFTECTRFLHDQFGHSVGMKTTNPLQLALAGLRRRAKQNAVQLVGFSSALVLLLTIFALRQDLLNEWQKQLPENSPNYFLLILRLKRHNQ